MAAVVSEPISYSLFSMGGYFTDQITHIFMRINFVGFVVGSGMGYFNIFALYTPAVCTRNSCDISRGRGGRDRESWSW